MSQPPNKPTNPWLRSLALWIGILLAVVLFVSVFDSGSKSAAQGSSLAYSEFLTKLDEGSVKSFELRGPQIVGTLTNDQKFTTFAPEDPPLGIGTASGRARVCQAVEISVAAVHLKK